VGVDLGLSNGKVWVVDIALKTLNNLPMKRSLLALVVILALITPTNAIAATKAGGVCKKAGQVSTVSGKRYTCVKSGNKLVWSKGVSVTKAKASPSPSNASTLHTSSLITALDQLTALDICKTKDVTSRSSGNNGFPRPAGTLIGAVSPKILFIPLTFPDTPAFSDADLLRAQAVFKEVTDFFEKTSYGLVKIEYEVLERSKWPTMDKSAGSYGLTNPLPQQNNTEALKEILSKIDPSVNFDLYDGVTIETARYPGGGVGQAFTGQEFPTKNGVAKRVSLETARNTAYFPVLAHELGHTLFGLEDLYVFLNAERRSVPGGPNPAGSWDMMSNSSKAFFGWSKFLNGWLDGVQVRCVSDQVKSVHYIEDIDRSGERPKLLTINLQEGVTISTEVRCRELYNYTDCGALIYKIDSRINHGDGPITAESSLLSEGNFKLIDGWKISALKNGGQGMLIEVEKVG
jgi:M6 family metalloprotease-like protein